MEMKPHEVFLDGVFIVKGSMRTISKHPDIDVNISVLSRFMAKPTKTSKLSKLTFKKLETKGTNA